MNKIWVLQNIQPENLGIADQVFQGCGLATAYIHTFAGEEIPRYMDEGYWLSSLRRPDGRVRTRPLPVYRRGHAPYRPSPERRQTRTRYLP